MMIHLHLGPAEDLIALIPECDVMICDPPYSKHVHTNAISQSARGGTRERELGFGHLTPELRQLIAAAAGAVKRWSVIYSDVESIHIWKDACEAAGARYARAVPWVRWSMPQLRPTRPVAGCEMLNVFHAGKTFSELNSPGSWTHCEEDGESMLAEDFLGTGALDDSCMRGDDKHKTQKPLDQALKLVSWFSRPGEVVLDLTAGRGTTALACKILGRGFIGAEVDAREHAKAEARLAGELSGGDVARILRYVRETKADESATTEPARARLALRLEDARRAEEYSPGE